MNTEQIREKLNSLTAGITSQVQLDALLSRYTDARGRTTLGAMIATEFPGADPMAVVYELESVKISIKRMV